MPNRAFPIASATGTSPARDWMREAEALAAQPRGCPIQPRQHLDESTPKTPSG